MAISYLSKVYSANPYVVPVDLNLMANVLAYKDQTFKKNAAAIDGAFKQMGTANVKPAAKPYIAEKVNNLIDEVNSMGGVDLGNAAVVNNIEGLTKDIYSDPIILKQLSIKSAGDATAAKYEAAAKDPKKSGYNITNHKNFMRKWNEWLVNPDLEADWNSDHKEYTPYTDIDKKISTTLKEVKKDYTQVAGTDGWYINKTTNEKISANKLKSIASDMVYNDPANFKQAQINAQELRPNYSKEQAERDMLQSYADNEDVLMNDLNYLKENLLMAKANNSSAGKIKAIEKQIEAYEGENGTLTKLRENRNKFLNDIKNPSFWSQGQINGVNTSLYVDKMASMYANTFSYNKTVQDLTKDTRIDTQNKIALDAAKNDLDVVYDSDGRIISARVNWDAVDKRERIKGGGKNSTRSSGTSATGLGRPAPGTPVQLSESGRDITEEQKVTNNAYDWANKKRLKFYREEAPLLTDVIKELSVNAGYGDPSDFIDDLSKNVAGGNAGTLDIEDLRNINERGEFTFSGEFEEDENPVVEVGQGAYMTPASGKKPKTRVLSKKEKVLVSKVMDNYDKIVRGDLDALDLPKSIADKLNKVHTNQLAVSTITAALETDNKETLKNIYTASGGTGRAYSKEDINQMTNAEKKAVSDLGIATYTKILNTSSYGEDSDVYIVATGEDAKDSDENEDLTEKELQEKYRKKLQGLDKVKDMNLISLEPSRRRPGYWKAKYQVEGAESSYIIEDDGVVPSDPRVANLGLIEDPNSEKNFWFEQNLKIRNENNPGDVNRLFFREYGSRSDDRSVKLAMPYSVKKIGEQYQAELHVKDKDGELKPIPLIPADYQRIKDGNLSLGAVRRAVKNTLNNFVLVGANTHGRVRVFRGLDDETNYEELPAYGSDKNSNNKVLIKFERTNFPDGTFSLRGLVGTGGQAVDLVQLLKERQMLPKNTENYILTSRRDQSTDFTKEENVYKQLMKDLKISSTFQLEEFLNSLK